MVIECPECAAQFKFPDERLSARPVRVRCSKCKHTFQVARGEDGQTQRLTDEGELIMDPAVRTAFGSPAGLAGLGSDAQEGGLEEASVAEGRTAFGFNARALTPERGPAPLKKGLALGDLGGLGGVGDEASVAEGRTAIGGRLGGLTPARGLPSLKPPSEVSRTMPLQRAEDDDAHSTRAGAPNPALATDSVLGAFGLDGAGPDEPTAQTLMAARPNTSPAPDDGEHTRANPHLALSRAQLTHGPLDDAGGPSPEATALFGGAFPGDDLFAPEPPSPAEIEPPSLDDEPPSLDRGLDLFADEAPPQTRTVARTAVAAKPFSADPFAEEDPFGGAFNDARERSRHPFDDAPDASGDAFGSGGFALEPQDEVPILQAAAPRLRELEPPTEDIAEARLTPRPSSNAMSALLDTGRHDEQALAETVDAGDDFWAGGGRSVAEFGDVEDLVDPSFGQDVAQFDANRGVVAADDLFAQPEPAPQPRTRQAPNPSLAAQAQQEDVAAPDISTGGLELAVELPKARPTSAPAAAPKAEAPPEASSARPLARHSARPTIAEQRSAGLLQSVANLSLMVLAVVVALAAFVASRTDGVLDLKRARHTLRVAFQGVPFEPRPEWRAAPDATKPDTTPDPARPKAAEARDPVTRDLVAEVVTLPKLRGKPQVLVMRGAVYNPADAALTGLRVRVSVFDERGSRLDRSEAVVGQALSTGELLKARSMKQLTEALAREPAEVKGGTLAPFTVLFPQAPRQVRLGNPVRYHVEVLTEARPARPDRGPTSTRPTR